MSDLTVTTDVPDAAYTPREPATAAELLLAAADEIRFRAALNGGVGWVQGKAFEDEAHRDTTRVCTDGALSYTATDRVTGLWSSVAADDAYLGAIRVLNELTGNFIAWNDTVGRTQGEVLGLLGFAARYADDDLARAADGTVWTVAS
jgi:hypothetical protein